MLPVRLKQAEHALRQGRLDEAYRQLQQPSLREHRQGQNLIAQLIESLLVRSRAHIDQANLAAALTDLNKARQLAGNSAEIEQLEQQIKTQLQTKQTQRRRDEAQLQQAERHLAQGWLSAVEHAVPDPQANGKAAALLKQADQEQAARQLIRDRLEQALQQKDWLRAAALLEHVPHPGPLNQIWCELSGMVFQAAQIQMQAHYQQGDIPAMRYILDTLKPIGSAAPELGKWQQVVCYSEQAAEALRRYDLNGTVESLMRIESLAGPADWLAVGLQQTQSVQTELQKLRCGPLGVWFTARDESSGIDAPAPKPVDFSKTPLQQVAPVPDHQGMILQVDGVGSALLLAQEQIRLGPISGSVRCDVPLMVTPETPVVTIERVDGDYFVLQHDGKRKLLRDGQNITVGQRLRVLFRQPHPASGTAVLEIPGNKMPRPDLRRVILLDREVVLADRRHAHLQVPGLYPPAVLFRQQGRFFLRTSRSMNQAEPKAQSQPVPYNETVTVGPLTLVLTLD